MNLEILKKDIERAIDPKSVTLGSIYVKVKPNDTQTLFKVEDDLAERIYERLPSNYRDHLLTIRQTSDGSYAPVFDDETQEVWDNEVEDYIRQKLEWMMANKCD